MEKIFISDIRSNVNNGKSIGHFIPVAKMYQRIFQQNNIIVAGGPIYRKYFNDSELLSLPYNISGTSLLDKIRTMRNCIKLFNAAQGNIIVLQQSSVITSFIGILLFYHSKSKLFLILYSNECLKSRIGRFLYRLIKNKINGIICPTDNLGKTFNIPYCVVPDYIYTKEINQERIAYKDFEKTKYDFCILGRIAPEKGVIESAQKLAQTKYKVLIAGRAQTQDLEYKLRRICSDANNIDLILDYISDEQYIQYLNQSKYALLNYQQNYSERSSGVVFDMLFNDVPVIGKECFTLNFVREENLGYLYSCLDNFSPELVMHKELYNQYINNINHYKKKHSLFILKLRNFIGNE